MRVMARLVTGLSVLLAIGAAGFLVACSGDDDDATATATSAVEASATRVDVTLDEWSVSPDPTSVSSGEIRFYAKNDGAQIHELILVRTDLDPADLPVYGASDTPEEGHAVGDVNEPALEEEAEVLGEVEDIDSGDTKDATFRLDPGNYVLFCNLPAHYGQGMRVAFTVE
jgi:uncharacterized cupredoxin-like copper-binding protein